VIHANEDDMTTDPDGNAGDRIASTPDKLTRCHFRARRSNHGPGNRGMRFPQLLYFTFLTEIEFSVGTAPAGSGGIAPARRQHLVLWQLKDQTEALRGRLLNR
jgi:hypothetical protein